MQILLRSHVQAGARCPAEVDQLLLRPPSPPFGICSWLCQHEQLMRSRKSCSIPWINYVGKMSASWRVRYRRFNWYCVPPLICTSCITNEYCTVFHPSFAQAGCHLHKLHNKWILYCVPQFDVICTSCITNEYCTVFHPSFAQAGRHLHMLHNEILLCYTPHLQNSTSLLQVA